MLTFSHGTVDTSIISFFNIFQIKREKAIKRKEALEEAKRQEEEARLAEVEGLVDLLQREPGPFRNLCYKTFYGRNL
jgi:hypothetical protein